MNFLVVPMYEYLGKFLKSERFNTNVLANLRANVEYWEDQIAKEEKSGGVSEFMQETNEMFEKWKKQGMKNLSPIIQKYDKGQKKGVLSQFPIKRYRSGISASERIISTPKNDNN